MIGQSLSHFNITAKLGEGGMGEVYRGEDTKLGREVAIKVLPEAVANDPERLARFEREAKVLASLNHPNIAGIHQVEEAEGVHFLVMELAEGEDLKERIDRGRLPVETALPIALQIAEALEAAHEKGIIHRDLKPANIKITPDGSVKVLDFGLAKALEEELEPGADIANSPTLTAAATQAGIIMGTAAYMSPEQAAGTLADRRSDIWSFGVVLAEMLTGRSQFEGQTVSHVLASVLKDDPDLEGLSERVPPRILELIEILPAQGAHTTTTGDRRCPDSAPGLPSRPRCVCTYRITRCFERVGRLGSALVLVYLDTMAGGYGGHAGRTRAGSLQLSPKACINWTHPCRYRSSQGIEVALDRNRCRTRRGLTGRHYTGMGRGG